MSGEVLWGMPQFADGQAEPARYALVKVTDETAIARGEDHRSRTKTLKRQTLAAAEEA